MKRRPVGYVATCQCGRDVGVIDLERTPRSDAGRMLGKWVADGCYSNEPCRRDAPISIPSQGTEP